MHLYLDEAGNFQIPGQPVAVVAGVAIADHAHEALERDFAGFVKSLDQSELRNREPKGSLLSTTSRERLIALLSHHHGFMFVPATVELEGLLEWSRSNPSAFVASSMVDLASKVTFPAQRQEILQLSRAVSRLHYQQLLRLAGWSQCIQQLVRRAIVWMSDNELAQSWNAVRIVIDPAQHMPGPESHVLAMLLPAWASVHSIGDPVMLQPRIHTQTHPLVKNYVAHGTLDMSKLYGDVSYPRSQESWAVQLADMCAAIVFRAAKDLDHNHHALAQFGALMRLSGNSTIDGPGLFTPVPRDPDAPMSVRYHVLSALVPRLALPAIRMCERLARSGFVP